VRGGAEPRESIGLVDGVRLVETRPAPALRSLLATLDDAGVGWCLLSSDVPEGDRGGVVDLLLEPAEAGHLAGLLADVGFSARRAGDRRAHRSFVVYDEATDRWFELNLVTRLRFGRLGELEAGLEQGCLSRRRRVGDLGVPAPDDAFWILVLRWLLDDDASRPDPHVRLRDLAAAARPDGQLGSFVTSICPPEWDAGRVLARARDGQWRDLESISTPLRRSWSSRQPLVTLWRVVLSHLRRVGTRVPSPRARGLSVALVAPDGAGKSTVAAALGRTMPLAVCRVYMGRHAGSEGDRTPVLALRLVRQWARFLRARWHVACGRIVVFDRYSYDALLPAPRTPTPLRTARRWLLAHALPPPDLAVLLDVPGDIMFRRKGEHDPERLEGRRQAYRKLAGRVPRIEIVDASGTPEDTLQRVHMLLWRALVRRARGTE
jgi:thymidylate kinase